VQTKLSSVPLQLERAGLEVRNLLAGRTFDSRIIESRDKATRQVIAAALLAARCSPDAEEQERARQLFVDHGYFAEATRDLKTAESPVERAAAARNLGIVGSPLATAHLVAAVFDRAPEVRRAGAEALIRIGDPWVATAPLNALLIGEQTRDVREGPAPTGRGANNLELNETVEPEAAAKEAEREVQAETWHGAVELEPLHLLYGLEVETARLKVDEEAQRLAEERAQMAGAGRRAKAEERRIEQGSITAGKIVSWVDGPPSLARRLWLLIVVNVLAAGALTIAGGLAIQFLVLPFWLGGLLGLLLYLLTLNLDKPDDDNEESQASIALSLGRQVMNR
jgi:hypothetical protein